MRELKAAKAPKDEITAAVDALLALKAEAEQANAPPAAAEEQKGGIRDAPTRVRSPTALLSECMFDMSVKRQRLGATHAPCLALHPLSLCMRPHTTRCVLILLYPYADAAVTLVRSRWHLGASRWMQSSSRPRIWWARRCSSRAGAALVLTLLALLVQKYKH